MNNNKKGKKACAFDFLTTLLIAKYELENPKRDFGYSIK